MVKPLPVRLTPVGDIEPDPSGQYDWRVTGARPSFRLDGPWSPGWHRLRLRYRADDTHPGEQPGPQVRFTGLAGPVSSVSRALALRGNRIDRIVFLPADADELFVDLPITARAFSLDQLDLRPTTQSRAAVGMVGPVARTVQDGAVQRRSLRQRAWQSVRERGPRGLRDQLVADYEAVQRRGAGLVSIPYREWLEYHDPGVDEAGAQAIAERIATMEDTDEAPTISVIVPVFDPPEALLRACIDSVINQRYPHWQLCLADDASSQPHVAATLAEYAAADARIETTTRPTNGHISAASNSALALATGEYVALLDHDDELPDTALFLVADSIASRAGTIDPADLLYTDEDKIDEHGRRTDPHFKPAFNRELMWGQHYMSHLMTIRRELVEHVGGFREGYEGSQDYDLVLRCVAASTAERIVHIPHVGYHWRAIEGSTALATDAKSYPAEAAKRALADHLPSDWTIADAAAPTAYTVRPPVPDPAPLVSIIIPTRNGLELVERCIESVEAKTRYPNVEIVLIDNQTDLPDHRAAFEQMAADGRLRLLDYDDEFNYSAINNFGVAQTVAPLICLLNNDIEIIEPGWLEAMVSHAVRPDVGAVGAMLLYGDDTIQHAGVVLGLGGVAGHSHKQFAGDSFGYFSRLTIAHQVGAVTAACLVVRRRVYEEVGGLDADDLAVAFNDIDLCLRIHHAGYRNIWTPEARLYHHESVSRGAEDTPQKQARFEAEVHTMLDRWGDELLLDPAYNPNLALDADSFTLARSPRVAPPWPRSARATNTLGRASTQE